MRKKIVLLLLFVAGSLSALQAQNVALKTNLLYWATTTPNLGLEASVGRKHTVQLFTVSILGNLPRVKVCVIGCCSPNTVIGSAKVLTVGSWAYMPWAENLMPVISIFREKYSKN